MGGGDYIGYIIALFTLTAAISRPFSGKLADQWGRIPVMVVGALVSAVACFMYPLLTSVVPFLLLRLFHGFSTGFKPTGTAAFVADIVPRDRRGEAMGIVGFFSNIGATAGPALGSTITNMTSIEFMFYTGGVFAILSVAILIGMKETLPPPRKLSKEAFAVKWVDIFEPRVLRPSVVLVLCVFSFGVVLTASPDFSESLGLSNKGLYFTFFTGASLTIRFVAGRLSDKYGRAIVLKYAIVMLFISMVVTGLAESAPVFLFGGVLFGLANGMVSPTVYAWTIDLSDEKHRGRGIATMYIFLEIGIGTGALLTGYIYDQSSQNFMDVFLLAAGFAFIAGLYLFTRKRQPLESIQNS